MLHVSVHPTSQTVQAILPTRKARGWGPIVNVTGLETVRIVMRSGYATAKAAFNSSRARATRITYG